MNNATSYYRTSGEQDGQLTSTLPSGSTSNTNVRYSSNDNSDGTIQSDTSISQTSHTIKKKRKNTNVACVNCSRNHSSCEQKRPCSRCIKKGIANTCVDAPRKKKNTQKESILCPSGLEATHHIMGHLYKLASIQLLSLIINNMARLQDTVQEILTIFTLQVIKAILKTDIMSEMTKHIDSNLMQLTQNTLFCQQLYDKTCSITITRK